MSILSSITEKPWEQGVIPKVQHKGKVNTRRAGLKVLLVVISALFFLFIVAFLMRSQYPDWQPLAEQPSQPLYDKSQLWLNTIYLIMASLFLQLAKTKRQHFPQIGLMLGGLFSCAFVVGQLIFWQHLYQQGFAVDVNPALSFFYLLTGLHATHVIIGLLVWLYAVSAVISRNTKRSQAIMNQCISLCAMYWHFLLGLWVLLFALLVSKPETYDAIVEFCGLGGV
ncbi:cytochrome c oxidase subunit III [Alteromonadaceae bacterium M269]|nr:cytochrome c oxidase subunit III [Alteromonadaceae bacterium M269]